MDNKPIKIDFLACERHNFSHLLPIWISLSDQFKGNFYILIKYDDINDFIQIDTVPQILVYNDEHTLIEDISRQHRILVTSTFYDDIHMYINRPCVFVAHGGGQTYLGQSLHLFKRRNFLWDILPNAHMQKVFAHRYPGSESRVVGCPKLDDWHINFKNPRNPKPLIALSFHFDRHSVPETRSAWPYYQGILPALAAQSQWQILGHGHPRILDELSEHYAEHSIEIVRYFDNILARADLYVCDHMSTLYEFASTGRPVVVLNAPWYRRDVEHGLRFWEHADVGINCDHPDDLFDAIELALTDPPEQQKKRNKAVKGVYAYTDGEAAKRAAQAIVGFSSAWEARPGFLYPGSSPEQVRSFLHDTAISLETVDSRSEYHQKEILKTISDNNPDTQVHIQDLEFHFWARALLLCKSGRFAEAIKISTDFYLTLGGSETLSAVFRHALLAPDHHSPKPITPPCLSVVVPLYNQGSFLRETVESVINQSYSNWELIIVDDGSTDDSLDTAYAITKEFPRHPITILTHPNKGKGFTRNRGVFESTGKYVCILDADDMLATTYLEEAARLLESNPDTGWITPVTLQFGHVHQIFYHFDFDMADLLTVCPSPVSSVFRRELWEEVGGFDQTMTDREDWEFWIKAAEAGWTSLHTDGPQFLYRIQGKRFGEREDINIQSKLEIIERHPWWFKPLTREELLPYCSEFSTCNLSPDILEAQRVARMVLTPKSRNLRKQVFAGIKQLWAAEGGQSASFQHLARHYALKGDRAKADQYRTAAEKARQAR